MIEITSQTSRPLTEQTRGLCPVCLIDVPARVFESAGQIWMEQQCLRHGDHRALLASDADEYIRLRQFVPDRTGNNCCCGPGDSCDNGVPPTCVLLLEITQACNLRCPTCYADAQGHDFMTIVEARRRLDAFFAKQSRLDVLMLSGGEPTIHPQFAEMLELCLTYQVERILVNTNGLRIAHSDTILEIIARHRKRVEVFLSFSSFRPAVHQRLYGRDLRADKIAAIERAGAKNIYVTLVPTVERGINDDEIGDLYRFALSQHNVNGINFQPVMQAGRYDHDDFEPHERLTLTDVIAALQAQTENALRTTDFVGLPCSHPTVAR